MGLQWRAQRILLPLAEAPQDPVGPSGHQGTLLTDSWSACWPPRPPGLSLQSSFAAVQPPACPDAAAAPPRVQNPAVPLLNPIRFLSAPLSASPALSEWHHGPVGCQLCAISEEHSAVCAECRHELAGFSRWRMLISSLFFTF